MIESFQKEYRWLSNFSRVDIEYDGQTFPSVEHAYVYAKTLDSDLKKKCLSSEIVPAAIKKIGQTKLIVPDWDDIKLSVMENLIRKKFQVEPYKTKLIKTGSKYIQEGNWWGDVFWGYDLKAKKGENHLGKIIMKIREELLNEQSDNA